MSAWGSRESQEGRGRLCEAEGAPVVEQSGGEVGDASREVSSPERPERVRRLESDALLQVAAGDTHLVAAHRLSASLGTAHTYTIYMDR